VKTWPYGFYTAAVAAKALALSHLTAAVMIAPKSEGSGPQTKDAGASRNKSAIAASAASLVSQLDSPMTAC
jgi:hypothetical protein